MIETKLTKKTLVDDTLVLATDDLHKILSKYYPDIAGAKSAEVSTVFSPIMKAILNEDGQEEQVMVGLRVITTSAKHSAA